MNNELLRRFMWIAKLVEDREYAVALFLLGSLHATCEEEDIATLEHRTAWFSGCVIAVQGML